MVPSQSVVASMMMIYILSGRAKSSVGNMMAVSMSSPPMVGVPCFSISSGRVFSPMFLRCIRRMNGLPKQSMMSSEQTKQHAARNEMY